MRSWFDLLQNFKFWPGNLQAAECTAAETEPSKKYSAKSYWRGGKAEWSKWRRAEGRHGSGKYWCQETLKYYVLHLASNKNRLDFSFLFYWSLLLERPVKQLWRVIYWLFKVPWNVNGALWAIHKEYWNMLPTFKLFHKLVFSEQKWEKIIKWFFSDFKSSLIL